MQRPSSLRPRDRAGAIAAVLLVHVAILAVLLASGRVPLGGQVQASAIETFDVAETPPPPPQPPPPERPREQVGQASPPNLKSQATPVVAPDPVVSLPPTTPVIAAEVPAQGAAPTQGAAPIPGPGTGAGGLGNGTGAGGSGSGPGSGSGGIATGPRQIAGSISRRDYPRELEGSDVPQEVVRLQYTIGADGRVHDCRILQSSGAPLLDQRTCELYEQRYRYEPARDAAGQPVPITVRAVRSWFRRGRLF
ncbi:energy transducer TonB [Sphingomonas sp. BN140010]|uniref:Protein TonB n=1 Tax=Sphingomonas arvum TaxID=2992113 RepID=A0ABT3JCG4_9SPHN|nr:energy transducer TonB [Sphingomonas sp. BN140010]MCW3796609.1 energy transducer TonB [Sphingomonas sp. BN140010]